MGFQRCMTLQIELMTVNPRPRHSPCKSFRAPQTPVEPSRLDLRLYGVQRKRSGKKCAVLCAACGMPKWHSLQSSGASQSPWSFHCCLSALASIGRAVEACTVGWHRESSACCVGYRSSVIAVGPEQCRRRLTWEKAFGRLCKRRLCFTYAMLLACRPRPITLAAATTGRSA